MRGGDLCTLILASQSQPACLCHLNEIQNLFHISFGEPRECRAETPSDYHQTVRQKSFDRIIIRCLRRGQIRTSLLDGVPRNLSKWMQQMRACLLFLFVRIFFFFHSNAAGGERPAWIISQLRVQKNYIVSTVRWLFQFFSHLIYKKK